jgi:fibronectin type 3 domain-containing protein
LSPVDAGSGITTSAVSPSEIDLSWARSPSASGYQVFRSDNGATGSYSLIASTAATVTSYADAGLTGSTQYCYEIRSFKAAGKNTTYSVYSAAACVTTLAPAVNAPSGVDVVPVPNEYFGDPTNSAIRVSWKDNSTNEDGFRVERASAPAGPWTVAVTTPANVISVYQNGTREQQVCFRVFAVSAAGASTASSADCTTPPANPTNLVAKAVDRQSITLTWTDNSAFEDGYNVSRLDAAGVWTDIATLAPNAASYRDAGVTADMTYTYRVKALKDGGFSDYTNESTAAIATTPPTAPLATSASYWADGYSWLYIGILWRDESNNEEAFRIESGDDVSGWRTYATTGANLQSFQLKLSLWDTPIVPTSACYRVIALNGVGESAPSNVICTEWANPPTNLTATAIDQQGIDLSWTDNASYERGYMVFRSTTVDGSYDFVAETPANATSYHDMGLASGQEYWYFVVSDFGGDSDIYEYSDRVSATTLSATGAVQSSRIVINDHLTAIRIRGRPTLEEVRARYRAAQTSTEIGAGGATPIRTKRTVPQMRRIRGRKAP